jgi:hypothetical protein
MNLVSGIALSLYRGAFRTNTTVLKYTCSHIYIMPALCCRVRSILSHCSDFASCHAHVPSGQCSKFGRAFSPQVCLTIANTTLAFHSPKYSKRRIILHSKNRGCALRIFSLSISAVPLGSSDLVDNDLAPDTIQYAPFLSVLNHEPACFLF